VGSRLLRRFVDAGVDCRALVRPGKEVPAGATPLEGNLHDADSLKQAVEGVSAIVHLAAVFRTQNEDDIWRANLHGTKNLIAAENELRKSGLNWSILRLGFVYGDGDGHLASVPPIVARFKWHPAKTFSLVHQRDVAGAVELALTGAMDGRIVNICDDAPTTLYEMASLVGSSIEPSAEPLTDPWMGRIDGSRLRTSLRFRLCIKLRNKESRNHSRDRGPCDRTCGSWYLQGVEKSPRLDAEYIPGNPDYRYVRCAQ
jgi:UDP-glucose 4-epimerase